MPLKLDSVNPCVGHFLFMDKQIRWLPDIKPCQITGDARLTGTTRLLPQCNRVILTSPRLPRWEFLKDHLLSHYSKAVMNLAGFMRYVCPASVPTRWAATPATR